ncbi:hypothetical protein [Bradyrhizobium sp. STM 3557]|uniref:hypothetical protein n=1 Tax=Bradyrhizobium sp. STM 3557 TaxID=578920 RepID=UPI00388FD82F
MFRRPNTKSRASDIGLVPQWYESDGEASKKIQAGIARLKRVPREQLAEAVFLLSMAAKRHREGIQQSIKESAGAEFDLGSMPSGDLANYLAEHAVSALRSHEANAPTLLDLLFERSPEARFAVDQRDAVAMLAAIVREQRIEGILEGLRLSGLLNEPSKGRHAMFGS